MNPNGRPADVIVEELGVLLLFEDGSDAAVLPPLRALLDELCVAFASAESPDDLAVSTTSARCPERRSSRTDGWG